MKNCILISAYFPPIGGVGVQRITKFTKYLRNFNWNPIVITLSRYGNRFRKDFEYEKETSSELEVYREFFFDYRKVIPGDLIKPFRKIEKKIFFPDKFIYWNQAVVRRVEKLIKLQKIDVIFINVPPFSGLSLVEKLRKKTQIPIVLNMRDPFSFNSYNIANGDDNAELEAETLENRVFNLTGKIVLVTPGLLKIYRNKFPNISDKFSLLTNGFDPEDFEFTSKNDKNERNNEFTVSYSGTFSRLAPIKPVLDSLLKLKKQDNLNIRLNIASSISANKIKRINKEAFDEVVNYLGFLSHQECIKNNQKSDLLIVSLIDSPATDFAIPGKSIEYVNSNTPILLINNQKSDVANMIEKTKTGKCVNINSPQEISEAIKYYYKNWNDNKNVYKPIKEEVEKYNYVNLTNELANIFDDLAT